MSLLVELVEGPEPIGVLGVAMRGLCLRSLPHPDEVSGSIRATDAFKCKGACPNCHVEKVETIYPLAENNLGATHAVDCPVCGYVYFENEIE